LSGREGNDVLTGGGGADSFAFTVANSGIDNIADFAVGTDKIVFFDNWGDDFDDLLITALGPHTRIRLDADDNGVADNANEIRLLNRDPSTIGASDFDFCC
ncbi:MAG: hypothetical protein AAGF45_08785, partial [Pseudomonadota bacterium]